MDVTPSILTADFCKLGETLDEAINVGINWIHMDVMDGNWVTKQDNHIWTSDYPFSQRKVGDKVFIDCHLMINNAEETWIQYVDAGVDMIIAH